jgi:hypothetical protein
MLTDMRLNQLLLAGAYFTAFVLILCGLTYFFVMQSHVRLVLPALSALLIGVLILWLLRPIEMPVLFGSSAIVALLFIVIVPRAITFRYIDRSAKSVSGGKYCYYQVYQEGRAAILTRFVNDLSFVHMLQGGSRIYRPAHVALITSDRIWVWSFWFGEFVEWQKIDRSGATPTLDGRRTLGRPSVEQVMKCWQAVGSS